MKELGFYYVSLKICLGVPLKAKKAITIFDAFQKILDNLTRKPNKIWVDNAVNFTIALLKNSQKKMI